LVELKDIAKKLEYILNANTLGKTFRVFSDSGELAKRNGHENEYRNGLLEIVSRTTSNLSGLEFISSSVNLTLYANEDARGKDSDGNSIEIIELRQILGDFLENYNFKTFAEEFGEKTYSTTYVIGETTTLPKGSLGYINDCIPLVTNIGLTFFENGVNSNEWQIYIDGEEVGYTNAVISRTKTAENMPLAESKSTKSVMQTNGFGLDLVVPQISSNLGNAIEDEILTGKEYAHMVYVKGKNTEQSYICVFGNLQASLIKNANVGFNVPLVEGVPELLDYKENVWLELEVEVTDLSYNTVTILNNDSENLYIFWGDGNTTKSNFEEIQHTYSNLGTYNIFAFNSKATDKDWADAVIRDYLELDKFTYTVDDNKITITKVNAPATTYEINGTYYIDNEVNTVTEIGDGTNTIDGDAVNITLPNTIKNINAYAFDGTSLTTINIPNTLEVVGDYAFRNTDITSITLPSTLTALGNYAFYGCSILGSNITIPSGITTIGSYVFYNSHINSVTLHSSITSIGSHAFTNCPFNSISLPEGLISISNSAFDGCSDIADLVIPSTVTNIQNYAFNSLNIEHIEIPQNCGKVFNAFQNCSNLRYVIFRRTGASGFGNSIFANDNKLYMICVPLSQLTFYKVGLFNYTDIIYPILTSSDLTYTTSGTNLTVTGVTNSNTGYMIDKEYTVGGTTYQTKYIGDGSNSIDSDLTRVNLSEGIIRIMSNAFKNSTLDTILIPSTVEYIFGSCFDGCSNLKNIFVDKDNTKYKSLDDKVLYGDGTTSGKDTILRKYAIGNTATSYAIPNGTLEIGYESFYNATNITSITIPEGVTRIRDRAFCNVPISTVIIPSTVTNIDAGAFYDTPLTTMTVNAITPPTLANYVEGSIFPSAIHFTAIYVPSESLNDYKTADGWSAYAAKMVGV
jgi:hypothetical protein